ncbi:hypothetical protein HMPREF9582_01090 [Cutibacterium acnes HL060PA1]|nr:hypothetical protein HMPREF9603_01331 [Cutibacterium acnes HL001PA1]EFT25239.1 hypothetical protein HMPREF9577_02105 [Cutibacterium acnes HL110PA3]EFT65251.1 hypothetical protein HMPREF9582_01090 [Cutibacterium acnes HL060PA1]
MGSRRVLSHRQRRTTGDITGDGSKRQPEGPPSTYCVVLWKKSHSEVP